MCAHGVYGGSLVLTYYCTIKLAMLLKGSSKKASCKIVRRTAIITIILICEKSLFQKTIMTRSINKAMEGIVDFNHLLDIAFFGVEFHMLKDCGEIFFLFFGNSGDAVFRGLYFKEGSCLKHISDFTLGKTANKDAAVADVFYETIFLKTLKSLAKRGSARLVFDGELGLVQARVLWNLSGENLF